MLGFYLFGGNVVQCWVVSLTINCLSCFCLKEFICFVFFYFQKRKKDIFYQNDQKYFTNTLSLRKHQSTAMLSFKLAVFFILSGRFAGTNLSPAAYSLPKSSPSL
jgi:hypothetical protein